MVGRSQTRTHSSARILTIRVYIYIHTGKVLVWFPKSDLMAGLKDLGEFFWKNFSL